MVIIINSASTFKGGSEQVALSFYNECKNFPKHQYHIIAGYNLLSHINPEEFPANFLFYPVQKRPATNLFTFVKFILWCNKLENKIKPDCVISTGGHGYWKGKSPVVGGFNMAHYIYSDSPYFKIISFQRKIYWYFLKIINLFFFNKLNAIIVQTEDVKIRLQKMISSISPIYVISNTVSSYFTVTNNYKKKLPEKSKNEIRLLTISSYYPHKNFQILKHVISELSKCNTYDYKFVLTLPIGIFKKLFSESDSKMIYNVGPVSPSECPSLYDECDFLLLPTLLECFSASYAEAMIMKKPILTSDLSFAHCVCKDAALYFDPLNPKDIANKIILLSKNNYLQDKLRQRGMVISHSLITAQDRARAYLDICERIVKGVNE